MDKIKSKLGTLSTLSIGIGGMVGGGIFAVTGLTIQVTRGGAAIAFLIAGIVALLTSYSYLRLTLKFPGEGGTVHFLNRAFGNGIVTGATNILLLFSYVVLVAVYAYAFGSYCAGFFDVADQDFWRHVFMSGAIVGLLVINVYGSGRLVIRTENIFNLVKMLILIVFVIVGLLMPMEWIRMEPQNFVTPLGTIAGAMLIFLNYEGFELIANASNDIANPKKTLPIAFVGGVLIAILIYFLIVTVVVGHLSFAQVAANSDHALSVAAEQFMGRSGFIAIAIAAILATSSAINATFLSTGKLTNVIAQSGELPTGLERPYRGKQIRGTLFTAFAALVVCNLVPLEAIATMGSAGFLLIFMAVNIANVKLNKETQSHAWLSGLAALSTGFALVVLCKEVEENPATRNHLWILAGMIGVSLLIEIAYRIANKRKLHVLGSTEDK